MNAKSTYSKKLTDRVKRCDSKQHLPCEFPGCDRTQCARSLCHKHWKRSRFYAKDPAERKRKNRYYNYGPGKRLPAPTRPEPEHCECCGKTPKRAMNLDHEHLTGEFRGWLCEGCNIGIGNLGDGLDGVLKAARYLSTWRLR